MHYLSDNAHSSLITCSIAAGCKLYHILSPVYMILSTSGDMLVESGVMAAGDPRHQSDAHRFKTPGLAINALRTPLHEPAITDNMDIGKLPGNRNGVLVNISGTKAYTRPEAEKSLAEVRWRDMARRDTGRIQ